MTGRHADIDIHPCSSDITPWNFSCGLTSRTLLILKSLLHDLESERSLCDSVPEKLQNYISEDVKQVEDKK